MSGGGVGGGSSSQSSQQQMGSLSPVFPFLASAFGLPTEFNKGVAQFGDPGQQFFGPQIIGPQQLGDIGGLLGIGTSQTAGGQFAREQAPGLAIQGLQDALGISRDDIIPFLQQAVSGDVSTFFDPAAEAFLTRFAQEEGPQAREKGRFGGIFDADVQKEVARTKGLGLADIGSQAVQQTFDIGLEAAPLLGLTAGNLANLPLAFAQDMEQTLLGGRQGARAETPGGASIELIAALQGLESPFGTFGESQGESMNFNIGIPCWVAAEYFGWYTPEWFAARYWIVRGWQDELGQAFRTFYSRWALVLALWIKTDDKARELLRPLFEWAAKMGAEVLDGQHK